MKMHKLIPEKNSPEQASALAIVLILLAILGIFVVVNSQRSTDQIRLFRRIEYYMDRQALIQYIDSGMDYVKTENLAAPACSPGSYITVAGKLPHLPILVKKFAVANPPAPSSATLVGEYLVRASCGNDHNMIVEAKYTKDPSSQWTRITNGAIGGYIP